MEVDSPEEPPPNQEATHEIQVWQFMNSMLINIFSSLGSPPLIPQSMEENLQSLLVILLRRSNNLGDILVPSSENLTNNEIQRQYTAFTTWLFGSMFYLISIPQLNPTLLKCAIEVQVCMLRILTRLHFQMHKDISTEYLQILDELMEYDANCNDESEENNKLDLNKFTVDKNIVTYLNLTSFQVVVDLKDVPSLQISILQIILESGVSSWNTHLLWNKIMNMIVKSDIEVKILGLKVCAEMMKYCTIQDKDAKSLIMYATEVVKTMPNWLNQGLLSLSSVSQFSDAFTYLVSSVNIPDITAFCFEIIDSIASQVINCKELEKITCLKIQQFLTKYPKPCPEYNISKYVAYYQNCPSFPKVLIHFVLYDVKTNMTAAEPAEVTRLSKLWNALRDSLIRNIQQQKFNNSLSLLRSTSILDSWFAELNISTSLYDRDIDEIQILLLSCLSESIDFQINTLIFENFVELMAHREANRSQIQNILLLPWTQDGSQKSEFSRAHIAKAKSLNVATKIACLEAVCRYGAGTHRLSVLHDCISVCEIDLVLAAIQMCPLLLLDDSITFDNLQERILIPTYNTHNSVQHQTLAKVIGPLVCLISKDAIVERESRTCSKWRIQCRYCDRKHDKSEPSTPSSVTPKMDAFLKPFYELFTSSCENVRVEMSKNLLRLSNHTKNLNSNATAKLWLTFVEDSNFEVRRNFEESIGPMLNNRITLSMPNLSLLQDSVSSDLKDLADMIMVALLRALDTALNNQNSSLHETLILTARNIGCTQLYLIEHRILSMFIATLLHPNSSQIALAHATAAYRAIAAFHNVSPRTLYVRYKKDFMKLMMTIALHNRIDHGFNMSTSIHRLAKCIGFQGSRQMLRKDGHHAVCFLLPAVIKSPDPKSVQSLLNDIAELIPTSEAQMFENYFQYICPYICLFEPPDVAEKCFDYISAVTSLKIAHLAGRTIKGIFSELMLNFHAHSETVIGCLELLAKFDNQKNVNFKSPEGLRSYLTPLLHGVLVTFDANLNTNSDERTQRAALSSLRLVIDCMGADRITEYRYIILATLRTALGLTRPGFRSLACDAWKAYLQNTFINELGPLLATICVSMIPLLKSCPQRSNAMLERLLVKNQDKLSVYIADLFFIKELDVTSNITDMVATCAEKHKPKSFEESLEVWIRRIKHETAEVRLKALVHLQQFLAEHRGEINDLILTDVNAHGLIVELLDTLMAGCHDKDENMRVANGECIGELGAVEPSLLPRRIISREESPFISDMNEEFAWGFLCELVRAFQMQKNTQSLDCFSLAIQELLKAYGISSSGENKQFWEKIPEKMQQIIRPFLSSHYVIMTSDDTEFPCPIYGSESGSTFDMWALNWTSSILNGINDTKIRTVLNACRPAFKRDIKGMLFCIPHIIVYVVANGAQRTTRSIINEMLSVINTEIHSSSDQELLRHRPVRDEFDMNINKERVSDEARRVRCSQVVFMVLDHVHRWLRERRLKQDSAYKNIEIFYQSFPPLILAQGCYKSYEYHRALMYLEHHMLSCKKGLSESTEGSLLAKIYTQLEEPDGVSGILASQSQCPTLQQLVLAHEVNGQLQDAATCYERLVQKKSQQPKYLQGMIQCYFGLDQPFTAMNITKGLLNNRPELEPLLSDTEPFWRLAYFSESDPEKHIKVTLLEDLKKGIKPDTLSMKKKLVSLLGSASHPGAYQQSYSYIMKLHVLNEFEKAASTMLNNFENLPALFGEWHQRGQLINASRGTEFMLSMRRAALDLAVQFQPQKTEVNAKLTEEIGKMWLKSAKIARKAGLYQQAYMSILSANDSCPPQELCIEQAQLYWQKGRQEEAFTTLERCFANYFKSTSEYKNMAPNVCSEDERKQCAKAKLLYAKYNDETLHVDMNGNMQNYKEAIEVWRTWDKSLLHCAQYYESIVNRMSEEDKDTPQARSLQIHILNYYGKSLQYGCKYIHQSMPRMLTIWLNFASKSSGSSAHRIEVLDKLTTLINAYMERLPTFMWLTAFSQLVSRICHPSKYVQNSLTTILVKLILAYPQHCLWMMASVFNSSYPARQKRCQEILTQPALRTSEMVKLIRDFNRLWERLIELSNKSIPDKVTKTSASILSRNLPRLLSSPDFSAIMVPATKFVQLHLPLKNDSMENHKPFLQHWVKIMGIDEYVMVMSSLQRPRRISLQGSDGKKYLFMCKPKDDLRRDFRLMEFNSIVNKYLQKDPESRRRRLYIRTYNVVPLNEECGLIEWVQNLVGLRIIITEIYNERRIGMTSRELKESVCNIRDPLINKRNVFLNKWLPRHPPVLGDWFLLTFPDAYGWYEARTSYIRTTAVMSMVGYILGLGDRHGENILIDSKRGDCVHVDFNCLFNRGELLDWPERVPFRLTHNMTEAMGPLKVEGPFRQSCQTTMRVLRDQASTLISVLTPFVYDPLVTWNQNQRADRVETGEKTNEKAVESIRLIEQRLKGMVRSMGKKDSMVTLHLSVEGQTNLLILDAMNVDNLCQMYIGWGAYM